MDSEQESLQFLGFFGIFKESLNIILTWPKIFLQITLAFILPHSCLYLAKNWISSVLINTIFHYSSTLVTKQVGSSTYDLVFDLIFSEWGTYWLITAVYFIFSIVMSLFTVSATVYTISCIYSGKDVAFTKVVIEVPEVWKRLMITFLCSFCLMLAYIFVVSLVVTIYTLIFFRLFNKPQYGVTDIVRMVAIIVSTESILVIIGFIYLAMIWQLANVVSVMEIESGVKALKMSKELIKGKMGTSLAIFLVMNLCATPIYLLIQELDEYGIMERICYGIISLVLWTCISLFALVVQTIFYLVCKSYQLRSVDKSSLADHDDDDEYFGEYAPLKID